MIFATKIFKSSLEKNGEMNDMTYDMCLDIYIYILANN